LRIILTVSLFFFLPLRILCSCVITVVTKPIIGHDPRPV
jgi:hypothetical protein